METPEPRSPTLACDGDTTIDTSCISHSPGEIDDFEDGSDSLSDIDDAEVDCYLNNEKEICLKKIIWEELNEGYLKEQALKKAAASKDASKAAGTGNSKAGRKRKQVSKVNDAQADAEDTRQRLVKKRLSSKINYDVVDKLFEEEPAADDAKRSHVKFQLAHHSNERHGHESDEAYAKEEEEDGDIEEGGYAQNYSGGWSFGDEEDVPGWNHDGMDGDDYF